MERIYLYHDRLNTISSFDKVIVLENGRLIEFGAPFELLCINPDENSQTIDRNTMFSQLVLQNMEHEVQ